ncbi:chitinase 1 [Canna indica]|uniref:chitinase n=1 Tax=Canna indica TaxID=4628 RepID=A0AAQ3JSB3_9LILI|nr:chitinase 1 [Canna indica]
MHPQENDTPITQQIRHATTQKETKTMEVLCLTIVSSLLGTLDHQCGSLQGGAGNNGSIASLIRQSIFDQMLKHRNDANCPAKGFYTYDAFIAAAAAFTRRGFATTGDVDTRKRELAAFFAQTSHETTGGWKTAPDGPNAWGYCFLEEQGDPSDYCVSSSQYPCAPGEKYYGRGPFQIAYNYNYGPAGEAIGVDLLKRPELVATDAVVSFKTALWFWMTPQSPKPSCHEVITGEWTPLAADRTAGRSPGFGVITNLVNGGVECGKNTTDANAEDRIGFYKRYCDLLGVSYGDHLDCNEQDPFA